MYPIQFPDVLDEARFLQHYWQKKPLYMPGAWPDFENPLPAEELAGLALEDGFPSRIVEQHTEDKWSLRHGPFSNRDFKELEGKRWSLLVTDIEKHLPDFMQYVQPFRFIPDWRFDDLMISYAPAGGSVGPHMDDYDVFLIQAEGRRDWHIEGQSRDLPQPESDILDDTDLRLIKHFSAREHFQCNTGDILYLPPRIGHHGVAATECMTWSMGFKAPDFNDMLDSYMEAFEDRNAHRRFVDPERVLQESPGEITGPQLEQLKNWFLKQLNEDDDALSRWLVSYLNGRHVADDAIQESEFSVDGVVEVETNPFVRFDFIRLRGKTLLYAGGEEFEVSLALAKKLTTDRRLRLVAISGRDRSVILSLLEKGYLLPLDQL